jgi:predicted kinase
MLEVILTKGLPGSGKSTWAKQQIDKHPGMYKRINKDELRSMLDNGHWSKANEQFIIKVRNMIIRMALEEGKHVIVDDTNLHSKHKNDIWRLVADKAVVRVQDFTDVPYDVCVERDLKRLNSVGERVIKEMYRNHLSAHSDTKIEWMDNLPMAIICDLDGTIALMSNRDPYDASTCEQDELNKPVAEIIRPYLKHHQVIFVSGRKEQDREPTLRWLQKHFTDLDDAMLLMRANEDNRDDRITKKEIYETHIKDKYNILFVLDDRQKVVEMWRDLGLTCLAVAEGDF